MIKLKKISLPPVSDVFILLGLSGIATGITFMWSWPLAALVSGIIVFLLGFLMASKG